MVPSPLDNYVKNILAGWLHLFTGKVINPGQLWIYLYKTNVKNKQIIKYIFKQIFYDLCVKNHKQEAFSSKVKMSKFNFNTGNLKGSIESVKSQNRGLEV